MSHCIPQVQISFMGFAIISLSFWLVYPIEIFVFPRNFSSFCELCYLLLPTPLLLRTLFLMIILLKFLTKWHAIYTSSHTFQKFSCQHRPVSFTVALCHGMSCFGRGCAQSSGNPGLLAGAPPEESASFHSHQCCVLHVQNLSCTVSVTCLQVSSVW